MRLLIRNRQAPGDVLVLTAAVRDLCSAYPGQYQIAVDTAWPAFWANNSNILPRDENWIPDRVIDAHYPLIHQSNARPYHFIHGFIQDLERKLNVSIPVGPFRGDIYLSDTERKLPSPAVDRGHAGEYWVVVGGGKHDFTAKWWNPASFQNVVDHFKGRIHFVQCGAADDWHLPLKGVTNLVGRTDLRELIRLIHHADGVLCPVTLAMHLAAAVPTRPGANGLRPCVVIAGGREPAHWEMYPGHQFLHTIGAIDCCASGGCWKSRCQPLGDGDPADGDLCVHPVSLPGGVQVGKCMEMITPARVIDAINLYSLGGALRFENESRETAGITSAPATENRVVKAHSPALGTPGEGWGGGIKERAIAVTIGVGSYAKLGELAAREVERRTGLQTIILDDHDFERSGFEHPAFLKFRLFDLVDADNILFFDADMACLADWDPSSLFGRPAIGCVRERMIPLVREESATWNVPVEEHFSSTGLMILMPSASRCDGCERAGRRAAVASPDDASRSASAERRPHQARHPAASTRPALQLPGIRRKLTIA